MKIYTLLELKDKLKDDLDLHDETFIRDPELTAYLNEAIDSAEAEIMGLYEDYFLTKANLSLVSGTDSYDMPADMYANKIRGIIYANGSTIFPIKRVRFMDKFEKIADLTQYPPTTEYVYYFNNSAVDGRQIVLIPPARETNATYVTVWYIRNATRLEVDADECDIPEFYSYVLQFAKVRCYEKEGHPNAPLALQMLEGLKRQMVETLSDMIPDGDDTVEMDLSHYMEMA